MTRIVETGSEPRDVASTLMGSSSSGVDVLVLDDQDRLVDTLLRVGQFRNLGPGWDSYGSAAPTKETIELVEQFITAADSALAPFLPIPHAVPLSNGGIKLAWSAGDRELELEFGPLDEHGVKIEFLRVSHGEPVSEGKVSGTEIVDHLTWLIQG